MIIKDKFNREQLNTCDKEFLITLILNQQEQLNDLNKNINILLEQIALSKSKKYGKKTESNLNNGEQLSFFNEAEALKDDSKEPAIDIVVPSYKRKKRKGKREEDLSGFDVRIEEHRISEEELNSIFPQGYKTLPDEIYKKLEFHPATYEVVEHHIKVYAAKNSDLIVKAKHPKEMFNNSIATPSLTAAIINAKYTNAAPLYRIEQEFERRDVHISRQVMSNWMIRAGERYLSLIYDKIKEELLKSHVVHADETPVMVTKDGREGMHRNYMWVYRSGAMCDAKPAIIYEYQKTRKQEYPEEFLKEYKGYLVCDGYQVYHSISEKRAEDIKVSGCWAHARRKFADIIKSVGKKAGKNTLANDILVKIAQIYHTDNGLRNLKPNDRKKQRELQVKPLVEALFVWIKEHREDVPANSETGKGLTYLINQEKYLKEFLNNGELPMDNNIAENALRSFCVGRNNWKLIDTVNGAKASAMIYSIIETAKANELKIYEYLEYLLTEIPKYIDGTEQDFLNEMLPWSENLPENIRKKQGNKEESRQ